MPVGPVSAVMDLPTAVQVPAARPGLWTAVARGLTCRCARCGSNGILQGFALAERCRGCGLRFDREDGFRAGALGVNTIATFGVLAIVIATGVAATMPDIAVVPLLLASGGVALLLPIAFYPASLTTWAALDVWMRPPGVMGESDVHDERARRVPAGQLAERLEPSLTAVVAAWAAAGTGELDALRRAFDGSGPAAAAMRRGHPAVRFLPDARVVDHALLAEGIDGWRVRVVVDGVVGHDGPCPFRTVLRWSPADSRWFAYSLEPDA